MVEFDTPEASTKFHARNGHSSGPEKTSIKSVASKLRPTQSESDSSHPWMSVSSAGFGKGALTRCDSPTMTGAIT